MKVEVTDLSQIKKRFVIEADPEEVNRETDEVVRRLATRVRVPGFRPGKVPVSLILTRYAREIEEDLRERLVGRLYTEATREKGLHPLGDPVLEEVSHEKGGPLRFQTTFEVVPEFTPKAYRSVEVREAAVAVADQDVTRMLEQLRESQVKLISEEGRAASDGDVIVTDLEGKPEGGEPFHRDRVLIEVGAPGNLPEFNDRIRGVQAGANLEFSVSYPKEHEAKHLAGKAVAYRLAVHEVKRREVPALDDEFARDVGEFENLAALRERIRADLEARRRAEARNAMRQSLLDKVLLENPIPLPEALVDDEIQHRLEEIVRELILQGVDPAKVKLDWKELRDRQEEGAKKTVHARLLLDAIAAAESIQVEMSEVDEVMRKEAERAGEKFEAVRARLEKRGGVQALKDQLVREKTLDFLTSVANIHHEG